ncbi:TonB-dependent receptor [Sphingobacterium kitahiroshimense]|uniref:TonB-dependent receptor n=1 Tax=Sphingobacterium kitahiroshimense TaxID=470446 RepID=UPI00320B2827
MILSRVRLLSQWGVMVIFLLVSFCAKAQNYDKLNGRVIDSLGNALEKTTITFIPLDGGKMRRTITNGNGDFSISTKGSKKFKVLFSMIGFGTDTLQSRSIELLDSVTIKLYQRTLQLQEVMVISHPKHPIVVRKDTVSYDLASFSGENDRYLSETLSRIKGLRVNERGEVFAQGEKISKITLNDEEIFNGDVGLLTRNLPLEILESAEVINDYGQESTITGMKGASTKTLNIHTKTPTIAGSFGELQGGIGSRETYTAGGTANYFDKKNQFSATAGANNINKPNMLSSSVFDNSVSMQALQEGLNRATNFSFNGRTKLGQSSQLYLSAEQANAFNRTFGEGRTTTVQQNDNIDYTENFASTAKDRSRKFNFRYELSRTRFAVNISPWIRSLKQERSQQRDALFLSSLDSARNYDLKSNNKEDGLGIDASVYYKFNKSKRTFAVKILSDKVQQDEVQAIFNDFNRTIEPLNLNVGNRRDKTTISPTVAYTEPLGKNGILEFSYSRNDNRDNLKRNAQNQDGITVDTLTGNVDSRIVKNHYDSRFQYQAKKWHYDMTLSYQDDYLRTDPYKNGSVSRIRYAKLLPSVQVTYFMTEEKSITLTGKQFNSLPATYQVVSIPTLTDPLFVRTGNADLRHESNLQASLSFKSMNAIKGSILRANLEYTQTDDKITASSEQVIEGKAQQFVSLLNADGYKRLSTDYFFSKSFSGNKAIDLSGRLSYDNNPQYINNEFTTGKNLNLHQSVKFLWTVSKALNLNPAVMYRLMDVDYGIEYMKLPPISTLNLLLDVVYKKGNFSSKLGANKFFNSGFAGNDLNNFIINTNISYKMFKGGCLLSLEVQDLLNNNTGIRRSVSNNTVSDLYVNRLSRYFMFSINYKIGNFK